MRFKNKSKPSVHSQIKCSNSITAYNNSLPYAFNNKQYTNNINELLFKKLKHQLLNDWFGAIIGVNISRCILLIINGYEIGSRSNGWKLWIHNLVYIIWCR